MVKFSQGDQNYLSVVSCLHDVIHDTIINHNASHRWPGSAATFVSMQQRDHQASSVKHRARTSGASPSHETPRLSDLNTSEAALVPVSIIASSSHDPCNIEEDSRKCRKRSAHRCGYRAKYRFARSIRVCRRNRSSYSDDGFVY